MRIRKLQIAVLGAVLAGAMSASASIVVNFDDLTTSPQPNYSDWGYVPASYAGLSWTGWEVTKADGTAGSYQRVYGNSYGAPSQKNFAYNGSGGLTVSTAGAVFDFIGADVSTFAYRNGFAGYSSTTLTAQGYLNNVAVGAPVTVNLTSTGFQWWNAKITGIDKLELRASASGDWWTLDNFTYAPVPEPTTMIAGATLLLPFGASTLRVLRKSRKA